MDVARAAPYPKKKLLEGVNSPQTIPELVKANTARKEPVDLQWIHKNTFRHPGTCLENHR
jgi:hypothetical protein